MFTVLTKTFGSAATLHRDVGKNKMNVPSRHCVVRESGAPSDADWDTNEILAQRGDVG